MSGKAALPVQRAEAPVTLRIRYSAIVPYVGDVPVSKIRFWLSRGASVDRIVRRYAGRITHAHVSAAMNYEMRNL